MPVFPVSYYAPSYPHYYLPAVQQKVAGAEAEDPRKELVKTDKYEFEQDFFFNDTRNVSA